MLVLQARRVSFKNCIVLLRLGRLSLAEKVQNVAEAGAVGALVYWDPVDANENTDFPSNSAYIPYHSDRSVTPFLHTLGIPTISLQYQDSEKTGNTLSVSALTVVDRGHHYKFHIAVMRVMVQTLLSMADDNIIPFSLTGAAEEITAILWQTSELLDDCSHSMQDLADALKLSRELEQTAKVFEEFIDVYRKNSDVMGLRLVNDIKMLFERLFIVHRKGIPHHILYPTEADNTMSEMKEMCSAGDITELGPQK
nr:hypothetical protein BaRGS_032763 [Batillaria attramentaria]